MTQPAIYPAIYANLRAFDRNEVCDFAHSPLSRFASLWVIGGHGESSPPEQPAQPAPTTTCCKGRWRCRHTRQRETSIFVSNAVRHCALKHAAHAPDRPARGSFARNAAARANYSCALTGLPTPCRAPTKGRPSGTTGMARRRGNPAIRFSARREGHAFRQRLRPCTGSVACLEHFQGKWRPVFRPKMRQTQEAGAHSVSIETESALGSVLNKDSSAVGVVIQGFRIGGGLDEEATLLAERCRVEAD